jgi:hypothetical protein
MICQVLNDKRLCPYEGIRTIKGGKLLCIVHIDSFYKGEPMKWAPKRLLAWEIERRAKLAVERVMLNQLNAEHYRKEGN